jgi:hypothetical protein
MSKRRTRKEKENAVHTYTFQPHVNGQLASTPRTPPPTSPVINKAIDLAQDETLASTKGRIVRSLLLVSLILALELVIYFLWRA